MKIIWIDCETGGVDPRDHDITQLAGIIDIDGDIREEFNFLMCPAHEQRVTAKALEVQGRTLTEVMAHPTSRREAWRKWRAIMDRYVDKYDKPDKFYWAGQMAPFDMGFGRALFAGNGDQFFHAYFHPFPIDLGGFIATLRLRGYFENLPNSKLGTICNALGIELSNAHDALADIRATRKAFYQALKLIPPAKETT